MAIFAAAILSRIFGVPITGNNVSIMGNSEAKRVSLRYIDVLLASYRIFIHKIRQVIGKFAYVITTTKQKHERVVSHSGTKNYSIFKKCRPLFNPCEFHSGLSLLLWFTHEADKSLRCVTYSF
jgi:hypothetical protein